MARIKECGRCERKFALSEFNKNSQSKDGRDTTCKACKNTIQLKRRRTKDGRIKRMYEAQVNRSIKRGHRKPEYSLAEFSSWLSSQTLFHELYAEWKASGFERRLAPSVDRKNNSLHYMFSNIKLMTCQENIQAWADDRNSKKTIRVKKDNKYSWQHEKEGV